MAPAGRSKTEVLAEEEMALNKPHRLPRQFIMYIVWCHKHSSSIMSMPRCDVMEGMHNCWQIAS